MRKAASSRTLEHAKRRAVRSLATITGLGLAGLLASELTSQEPSVLPPGRPQFAARDGLRIHLWERAPRDLKLATSTGRVLL